jgi:EmrB/QacA subfamily drug resistance transporter
MAQARQARSATQETETAPGIAGPPRTAGQSGNTGNGGDKTDKTHVTSSGAQISRAQLVLIMLGVILGLLLSSLDQTIVGPALFKIVKDLQGLEHYSWVTTGYLLTSTITIPIVGKLSDIYGRKWFFVAGMVVFLVGSALSGQASGLDTFSVLGVSVSGLTTGMAQLIGFRALQGIGGGMITATAFTVIADLFPPAERGRWQGLFGAVFGLASVVGPTVGGYLTDNVGWRWVFYVNLPIGIVAVAVVAFTFPHLTTASKVKRSVDWLGAATLIGAVTPILVALSLGGSKDFPWDGQNTIMLFAVGGTFLIAFIVVELLVKEPILPLDLFKNRIFALSVVTMALVGIGMFGAIINLPLFIQGVQGASATTSGNTITPMMLSLIVVSAGSGQILSRTGRYRILGIVGTLLLTGGLFLLSTMTVDTTTWQTVGYMVIIGAGLGVAMPIYTVIVQNALPVERLGVVTAATTFFRSIGGTIGIAVLGGVVNNRFSSEYTSRLPDALKNDPQFGAILGNLSPQALVSPDTITAIGQQLQAAGVPLAQVQAILTALQAPIKPALAAALTEAFLIGAIIVAVAVVTTALIPEIPLRRSNVRAAAVEGGEFAVGVDESPEALSPAPVPIAPAAAISAAPAPAAYALIADVRRNGHQPAAPAQATAGTATNGRAPADLSGLTWGALGLTLATLAREAQSGRADPRLLAALSDAVDGRYPHSWSTQERGQAVARDLVAPLAEALLAQYVAGQGPSASAPVPATNGRGTGADPGYSLPTEDQPTLVQPRKMVRVSRKLVVDGQVVGEQAAEDLVPLDADTEAAAARLRARLDALLAADAPRHAE